MSIVKEKLTDTQLRVIQVIAGILCGVALSVTLFLTNLRDNENIILQYLWLIVFVIIMFGRRWIERKFKLRFLLYNLVLVDTLVVCIVVYLCILFYTPLVATPGMFEGWSDTVKLLVVIVPSVAVLILGVVLPLFRYQKRKENGTLRSVRLPEPKEPDETEQEIVNDGPMTIEQKVAAMTRELDGDKENKDN